MESVIVYGYVGETPTRIVRALPIQSFEGTNITNLGFYVRPVYQSVINQNFSENISPNAFRLALPISFAPNEENYYGLHTISSLYALNTVTDFAGLPLKGIPTPYLSLIDQGNGTPQNALSVAPFVFNDNQEIRPLQRPEEVVSDVISPGPGSNSVILKTFGPDRVGICLGYSIMVTGNASTAIADIMELQLSFDNGVIDKELGVHAVYVPNTAGATGGNLFETGWVSFHGGVEAPFAGGDLVLNIRGIDNLDTGEVWAVVAIGSRPDV